MRLLKSWLTALAPNSVRSVFTVAGARGILLMGLLSVGTIGVGTWYLTTLDVKRAEDGAFQDTANLARAFEENIIRLIQECDQILLSARASFLREGDRFDLAQWAHDQRFVNDVTMQIAISDKTGILTASNATGQLLFLPLLAGLVEAYGWQVVSLVVAAFGLAMIPVIALFMRNHPFDVEVDGHRVLQLLETCEPQCRQRLCIQPPGRRESGQITVREGEHDDIGWRLFEIDRGIGLFHLRDMGRQHMHA